MFVKTLLEQKTHSRILRSKLRFYPTNLLCLRPYTKKQCQINNTSWGCYLYQNKTKRDFIYPLQQLWPKQLQFLKRSFHWAALVGHVSKGKLMKTVLIWNSWEKSQKKIIFELKPCCSDHTTPMIHNLKPCIPFDNLLDVFLFTLRQGWGSRDCTAARGLACIQCGWGSSLIIRVQRKSVLQPAIWASCT